MSSPTLDVENLWFAYPDGQVALQGISFSIAAGEKVALIGPNGAGKSTLLWHLNGLLQPQRGQVRVAGLEARGRTLGQVRAAVGLVFQDPNDQLFSPTVFEDVAFGPLYQGLSEVETRARVAEALAAVGMSAYATRASHRLSLGEKKRIALATVLALRPALLALDEPTAGLDPRARRQLSALLGTLPPALLIATHDLGWVAEVCTRMVVLDAGRVVASGPTAAILSNTALLEQHGLN